ncbi:DUF4125 family protein [Bifidobacterium psychraerophilum]|jgi:hypothetical protein|uniref:DUF4125 domain-containing protein n=1 Tax=Bifidobacterium psychraerophilum TaxID=218140 RepID=A0A087CG34_9BIFI|nr:DUF4125 family protein [Bifidobacterium psychraerophilum]KFI82234.1 hypothetical protein BPSY_1083 [Bifidobacterium psychraerophilum]PKA95038.1 uncharacterized protein DUF4125 [Bifidobacterium psychraerophilum DSM 22366]
MIPGTTTSSVAPGSNAELAESIVAHEWSQFQRVNNEGGPASCQSNWPVFHQMRLSQFLAWPRDLLTSYAHDLEAAERSGRNLLTEKYARMMESTVPDEFHRSIEPYIPKISAARQARQERIIVMQLGWAQDFMQRYRALGASMRTLRSADDTAETTSFESYLRGELGTYSEATLALYESMMQRLIERGSNLTESIVLNTMRMAGYSTLQEAEQALEQGDRS